MKTEQAGKSEDHSPKRNADREILSLALPAAGAAFTALAHTWVDTAWIGRSEDGALGIAALGIASFTVWIYNSFGSLLVVGLTAIVGRYCGAGKIEAARYTASQGLRGAIWLAGFCAVAGYFLAPYFFRLAGGSEELVALGAPYVRIYWGGGFVLLLGYAAAGVFRGHGDTRVPFLLGLVGLALNVILDPIFIFGLGPIPAMGVAGAAWATVICFGVSAVLMLVVLRRRNLLESKRPSDEELRLDGSTRISRPGRLGLDYAMLWRLGRIGHPVAMAGVFFSLVYLGLTRIVEATGGSTSIAALAIGHRGEGLAWVIYTGYNAAASSLVARYMGEKRIDLAENRAWRAALQCALISALWGGVLFVFGEEVGACFIDTKAPGSMQVIKEASIYFKITSWSFLFQACDLVLGGAFSGAGLTLSPMLLSASITATRLPLAVLATTIGRGVPEEIWWVIAATAALKGILIIFWFRRGTWKTRSV